jgi:hypothetical protein
MNKYYAIPWCLLFLFLLSHAREINAAQSIPAIQQQKQLPGAEPSKYSTYSSGKHEGVPRKVVVNAYSTNTHAVKNDGILKIEVINKQVPPNYSLYGALVAIGIPLLVLLVTNFVTLFKIRLESKAAIRNELGMDSIGRACKIDCVNGQNRLKSQINGGTDGHYRRTARHFDERLQEARRSYR